MSAYTLEITNGTTTYTLGGPARPQPDWEPDIAYEYDQDASPAVVTAEIETWALKSLVYVNATPGTLTSDLETLAALLRNRSSPVTSVTLKYGGSTIRSMSSTTHAQLMVRALRTIAGPGAWVNHWRGDLVIVGRKVLPDASDIVKVTQKVAYSYDEAGLLTQTLTGRIEVTAGTDVVAKAQGYALTSLGSAYVFTTGGLAAGAANIDVEILNHPTDTIAEFRSQQKEKGVTIPATATDWSQGSSIADTPDGRLTTTRVSARGTSIANARTAVKGAKPATAVRVSTEREDKDSITYSAEYVVREPLPTQAAFYSLPTILSMQRRVTVRGGGQPRILEPVPGYRPYETLGAQQPVRVTERISMRCTNVSDPGGIPLPEMILAPQYLQPDECEDDIPFREEKAEADAADVWSRSASRVYELADISSLDYAGLFAKLQSAPRFASEPDFKVRGIGSA